MDSETITIIVALAGLMIGLTRMNTKHLDDRINALRTELGAELGARIDKLGDRIGRIEAEVVEVKTTVARTDSRLYDLATGRHAPLIVADR